MCSVELEGKEAAIQWAETGSTIKQDRMREELGLLARSQEVGSCSHEAKLANNDVIWFWRLSHYCGATP